MFSILFGLMALLVVIQAVRLSSRGQRLLAIALAGLLGAGSIGCHPLGIPIVFLSVVYLLAQESTMTKKLANALVFVIFPGLALIAWMFWRYFHTGTFSPPDRDGFPPLFPVHTEFINELARHAKFHARQPFALCAWVLGIVGILRNKHVQKATQRFLLFGMLGMCLFFYVSVRRSPRYLFAIVPLGGSSRQHRYVPVVTKAMAQELSTCHTCICGLSCA
jgi:uncharacterized membrane protein